MIKQKENQQNQPKKEKQLKTPLQKGGLRRK